MAESGGRRRNNMPASTGGSIIRRAAAPRRAAAVGTDDETEAGDGTIPRPEEKLNKTIFWFAVLFKLMNGFGTLAFVWATVVLLGGFSTLIKPDDFWRVTVIVFIQASRCISI
uniref:Uncharacterized protein n=1 Tax=Oryza brachyantha TaxID=4533 RepID=J3L0K0_ORYBR